MLKKLLLILTITIIIIFSLTTIKISSKELVEIKPIIEINNKNTDDRIGTLIIKEISLEEPLYNINSPNNTIEKHVTILKESILPPNKNSIIFIAAHSGTGKIAYFNELDKLKIGDEITLLLNNNKYKYIVKEVWEEKKNGYINVNKEEKNQLILTTCSPNKKNYQLVINCIEKES